MAKQPTPIATVHIRDDVSVALEKIKKQFAKQAVDFSETMAYGVGRNLGSVFGLLGISGTLVSGGLVASLAGMTISVGKFAQKGLSLNSTVMRLNMTLGEYQQLVKIGMAGGLSKEQAEADVQAMAEAVLDLRRGTDSDTRAMLEKGGTFGTGTVVARQLRAQLERDGDRPYETMKIILRQMRRGAGGTDADRQATQVWRDSFGLQSPAWNQAIEAIDEFAKNDFEPVEKEMGEFLLAQVELQREVDNLYTEIAISLMPAMSALSDWLSKMIEPANAGKLIAEIKRWVEIIENEPWDVIRQRIDAALGGLGGGISKFVANMVRVGIALARIVATVASWQKQDITGSTGGGMTPVNFSGGSEPLARPDYQVSKEYEKYQLENAGDLPESVNIEDRRFGASDSLTVETGTMEGGALAEQLGLGSIGNRAAPVAVNDNALERADISGVLLFSDRPMLTRFQQQLNEMRVEFDDLYAILSGGVQTKVFSFSGSGGSYGGGGSSGSWGGSSRSRSGGTSEPGGPSANPRTTDNDPQAPAGAIEPGAVTAVGGAAPSAFIMHHTSGRGDASGVASTLQQRGLGVQYVMERDGTIKQIGGPGSSHMRTGWGPLGKGLSNRNTVGMEVIAKDDKDVTPAQIESAKKFIEKYYPNTPLYGHGQVNPGHKEEDEGMTIIDAIKKDRRERAQGRKQVDGAINGWEKDDKGASLDLEVKVRSARGTKVNSEVKEGTLMAQERVTVEREITAAA
jgi:hypothetical protein